MRREPFDRVWDIAMWAFFVAAVGLVTGAFFKLMLFVFPVSWKFWHGLCHVIYFVAIWAFRIGTPVFVILSIVALVGSLIYRLTCK